MLSQARNLLKQYYGFDSFRSGQEKIIASIMNGVDTLAIMPTGAGKSICFQIPSLLAGGITIVVSPLISLMKDQVDDLSNIGINAAYINSSLTQSEVDERIFHTRQGKYKMVYVAPERLESEKFCLLLRDLNISFVAVDEAHCVSSWGHDFRPSYKQIAPFISSLPQRPKVAAFTATATLLVRQDIVSLLALRNPNTYITGFNRENLFFGVLRGENKMEFVKNYVSAHAGEAGIIYAATRKEVDNIYAELLRCGFAADRYHAGMTDGERTASQEAFTYDNIKTMVATNAFGMGIDKPDVRYVIHYNMPKNMEAYYQEAGRAGRDGDPSECLMLYSPADVKVQKFLIEQSPGSPERQTYDYQRLQYMVDYAYTDRCLRKYILNYFEEETANDYCGNCSNCPQEMETVDITLEAKKVFSCVLRLKESYGITMVAGVLKGSESKKILGQKFNLLTTYGLFKDKPMEEIKNLINLLAAQGYLSVTEGKYPAVCITQKAIEVLRDKKTVAKRLAVKKPVATAAHWPEIPVALDAPTASHFALLFEELRSLRRQIAFEQGVPPYVIFADSTLRDICQKLPVDMESFGLMKGVGEIKTQKYGEIFLKTIAATMSAAGMWPPKTQKTGETQTERRAERSPEKQPSEPKSHIVTWQMHQQGLPLYDIARKRALTPTSIQNHLTRCHQEGLAVNWGEFIPKGQESAILAAVKEAGTERLKPIRELLGESVSYFAILAVIMKHAGDSN